MMFRESVQVLICLSVLFSTTASLHMIKDAYHRPTSNLNNINSDSVVIDSNNLNKDGSEQSVRATRNPPTNIFEYHQLFPSSLASSISSSSPSSPSATQPHSLYSRGGPSAHTSPTDTDRYRWEQVSSLQIKFPQIPKQFRRTKQITVTNR